MGYFERPASCGGSIRCFTPDDSEEEIYLNAEFGYWDSDTILNQVRQQWGADITWADLSFSARHLQTDCLDYDRYEPCDWTTYLVITRKT